MTALRYGALLLFLAVFVFLFITNFGEFSNRSTDSESNLTLPDQKEKKYEGQKITMNLNRSHFVAGRYLAKKFHEKTGAVVEFVDTHYSQLDEVILDDFHSDSPRLDVLMFWYIYLGQLVEEGVLRDLTDFIKQHEDRLQTDDFIPSFYQAYTLYQGRRWGLPFDADIHVLLYNKSILRRHGLAPPETWDDFLNASKLITEKERAKGIYGTSIMAYPNITTNLSIYMNRLVAHEGRLLDENNKPNLDSPEAIAALEELLEQSRYALPVPTATDYAVSVNAFLAGQIAMQENWSDLGITAEDETKSLIKGQWGMAPIPSVEKGGAHHLAMNAGYTLSISSKAVNPELAEEFLLFASTPQMGLELNMIMGASGVDPVRFSTINSPEFTAFAPTISAFQRKYLAQAKPWPTTPESPELMEILGRYVHLALSGVETPREAMHNANREWIIRLAK
jgi:multiple sugar transport system substrate-binding protein